MGIILSLSTLCLTIRVILSTTMTKIILLCVMLAFASSTYGDCWDECTDVFNTCMKECPASQECQYYIEDYEDEYYDTETHPCGKCGEECLVDEMVCKDKCYEMEAK